MMKEPLTLAQLITERRGTRTLTRLAEESNGAIAYVQLQRLSKNPLRAFPEPATIHTLATILDVTVTDVLNACATTLGLPVGASEHDLVIRDGRRLPQTAQDTILLVAGEFQKVYGLDGRRRTGTKPAHG